MTNIFRQYWKRWAPRSTLRLPFKNRRSWLKQHTNAWEQPRSKHIACSWIKIDQLDVNCFIISLFTAQHVSNVSTSIFKSLRLTVDLFRVLYCSGSMFVGVTVWFGWVVWYPYAGWSTNSAPEDGCTNIRNMLSSK